MPPVGFRRVQSSLRIVSLALALGGSLVLASCDSAEERAEAHYRRGLELAEQGQYAKAGLEFRNSLKLRKESIPARYELARAEERAGNLETAFKIYMSVIELDPKHVEARNRVAAFLLGGNQVEQARKFADQAMALAPEDSRVLVTNAAVAVKERKGAEAVRLARLALAKDPSLADAYVVLATERLNAGDPAGVLEVLNERPIAGETDIGLQTLRLAALEATGDEAGVEDMFARLVEASPEAEAFREGWAKWYLSKNRIDDAERVVRDFAESHPEDAKAQLNLVGFLNSQRGITAAIDELKAIIDRRKSAAAGEGTAALDPFELEMPLVQLMVRGGQIEEARALLEALAEREKDPVRVARVRVQLAALKLPEQKIDEAQELVERVLKDDPRNVEALQVRAQVRLAREDVAGASEDLRAAINEAPNDPQLHALLASIYERGGSTVLAEEQFSKSVTLSEYNPEMGLPMARFLLRYGKVEQARRVLENVVQRSPRDIPSLSLLAQLRLASQDWAGAQEISERLRQATVEGAGTAADRISAAAMTGMNRHADSIKLLETAASERPDDAVVLPDLIRSYLQAGRGDAAAAYLVDLISREPDRVEARVLLGSVYMSMEKADEAEAALKEAAARDTGALGDTALAQFYQSANRLEDAEAAVRGGLKKDSASMPLRLLLTTVYQRQGKFDEAIAEYEELFKADPESTIAANDLASLLSERRGDPASLERAFEIAQRFRNSEIPQYLDTLGWIYHLRGEHASALPLLKTAAEKLPDVGLIQYHYGMALLAQRQGDRAKPVLERALKSGALMTEADLEQARSAIAQIEAGTAATATQ